MFFHSRVSTRMKRPWKQLQKHFDTFCTKFTGKQKTYIYNKVRFKRRILHVPNLMQMSKNNRIFSFALDSAHVKCDI